MPDRNTAGPAADQAPVGAPAPNAVPKRPAKAKKSPGKGPSGVDHLAMSMGLLLLLIPIAVACFQPAAFERLTFVFRIICALGAGLMGAAIPGYIQVEGKGIKAGGAAAFFVVVLMLDPTLRVSDQLPQPEIIVLNVFKNSSDLWGHYLAAPTQPNSAREVRDKSPQYMKQLDSVADKDLSPAYQILKYETIGWLGMLAASLPAIPKNEISNNSARAISSARKSLELIDEVRREAAHDSNAEKTLEWVTHDEYEAKAKYHLAVGLAAQAQLGLVPVAEALDAYNSIPGGFMQQFQPITNLNLKWLLDQTTTTSMPGPARVEPGGKVLQ